MSPEAQRALEEYENASRWNGEVESKLIERARLEIEREQKKIAKTTLPVKKKLLKKKKKPKKVVKKKIETKILSPLYPTKIYKPKVIKEHRAKEREMLARAREWRIAKGIHGCSTGGARTAKI